MCLYNIYYCMDNNNLDKGIILYKLKESLPLLESAHLYSVYDAIKMELLSLKGNRGDYQESDLWANELMKYMFESGRIPFIGQCLHSVYWNGTKKRIYHHEILNADISIFDFCRQYTYKHIAAKNLKEIYDKK